MDDKKERKEEFDDGHTVTDMSADWMPWNRGLKKRRKIKEHDKTDKQSKEDKKAKKKEFRKLVMAQYLALLPAFLCIIIAFAIIYILLRLWIS